jgi:sulfur-oxidizing protein SoxZ
MATARISMPTTAKAGAVIEIKTLVQHIMETGHRRDESGRPVPRDIINRLVVTYAGAEIFRMDLYPGIAANPYIAFPTVATETGDVVFAWTDDAGQTLTETRRLTVT